MTTVMSLTRLQWPKMLTRLKIKKLIKKYYTYLHLIQNNLEKHWEIHTAADAVSKCKIISNIEFRSTYIIFLKNKNYKRTLSPEKTYQNNFLHSLEVNSAGNLHMHDLHKHDLHKNDLHKHDLQERMAARQSCNIFWLLNKLFFYFCEVLQYLKGL